MRYGIAGMAIDIDFSPGCPIGALTPLEPYLAPADGAVDLSISCAVEERIPALELDELYGVRHLIQEHGRRGGGYVSQDRDGGISYATLTFDGEFRRVSCALTDVSSAGGEKLDVRLRVALGCCVRYAMPAFGAVTFHASAISVDGQALLFAAPSGTGKSTQSRLWKERFPDIVTYINDDAPILKVENGVCRAYGSPWAGTSGINTNISAPVKAVIYVERGTDNTISPVSGREKFLRAFRSVRKQYFPVQIRRQTEIIFSALSVVPVYTLRCDMSQGAVEAVKSLLF